MMKYWNQNHICCGHYEFMKFLFATQVKQHKIDINGINK